MVRLEVRMPPRRVVPALVRRDGPEQQVLSRDFMSERKRMGAAKPFALNAAV